MRDEGRFFLLRKRGKRPTDIYEIKEILVSFFRIALVGAKNGPLRAGTTNDSFGSAAVV